MTILGSLMCDKEIANSKFRPTEPSGTLDFLTVHDAVYWYVPEDVAADFSAMIKPILENVMTGKVDIPMKVDIGVGDRWGSLEKEGKKKEATTAAVA